MRRNRLSIAAITVMLAASPLAHAQIDDQAVEHMRNATQRAAEAESITVDVTIAHEMGMAGQVQSEQTAATLYVERPDRLAIHPRDERPELTLVADGENVYELFHTMNRYIVSPGPDALEPIIGLGEQDQPHSGMSPVTLFGPLLSLAILERWEQSLAEASYEGQVEEDGQTLHHLRFRVDHQHDDGRASPWSLFAQQMGQQGPMAFDVWVSDDEPRVVRVKPDLSAMMEQMAQHMPEAEDFQMDLVLYFEDWNLDAEIDEARFAFSPPEDAEAHDTFEQLVQAVQAEQAEAQGQHGEAGGGPEELVGEPAPDFELELLRGGDVRLEDHIGQDVVVLDFWATWCGPCIQAMPMLIDVAERFGDENFAFYGINLVEDPDQVQQFVDDQGWDFPVPMDRTGEIGQAYRAHAIPLTVVIGLDGNVEHVHTGFSPDLDENLTEIIESLLAGE